MKRTIISLCIITVLIIAIVVGDLWFMSNFADGMNTRLDAIAGADTIVEKKQLAAELDDFYMKRNFWAHRLVPTNRMEDLETLLHKLNAYLKAEEENEIEATVAEVRARVNLLYSTSVYHWYHPAGFCIE